MDPIEERKKYLQKRNEAAKKLLSKNIEEIDIASYVIPDFSLLKNMTKEITSNLSDTAAKQENWTSKIAEWILTIKKVLED